MSVEKMSGKRQRREIYNGCGTIKQQNVFSGQSNCFTLTLPTCIIWGKKHKKKDSFTIEVKLHKLLQGCSNVLSLISYDEQNLITYTPFCKLGDLFDMRCKLNNQHKKIIEVQMSNGIKFLHSRRIVHRDIKLENVLVDSMSEENINIKITDFGMSKVVHKDYDLCNSNEDFGTCSYRAPESFKENEFKHFPLDLWAFGVFLFFIWFGYPPFTYANKYDQAFFTFTRNIDEINALSSVTAIHAIYFYIQNKKVNVHDINSSLEKVIPAKSKKVIDMLLCVNPAERPAISHIFETFSK